MTNSLQKAMAVFGVMPAHVSRSDYDHYKHTSTRTDSKEFPGRAHLLLMTGISSRRRRALSSPRKSVPLLRCHIAFWKHFFYG